MSNDSISSRSARRSASFQGFFTLIMAAIILVIVNYLGFKYYVHKDLTQSQLYTLSPKTVDILKRLDSPITISTLLSPKFEDQIDNLLKEYQRIGGKNVIVEKIDPAYDAARAAALQKRLHFQATDFIIIFEYKDQTRFLKQDDLFETNPMTGQIGRFKGEQQFTSTILSLVEGHPSKVYFTEGHGEHSIQETTAPQGYGAIARTLKNDNIETANLNLVAHGEVPADADAVVIAGPSISFSAIEADILTRYLANNGKLFILLDPYVTLGLDNLLQTYGMKFDNDLVLYRGMTASGGQMTVPLAIIYQGGFSPHPATTKLAQANLQLQIVSARSVSILNDAKGQPNPKVQFLLQTDSDAWGWVGKGVTTASDDLLSYQDRAFDKATDLRGPLTISAEYDGGMITDAKTKGTVSGTRVITIGSSKFLQNDTVETVGANFFDNCLSWLVKKDAVLDIAPKTPQEYGIELSPMQSRTVAWSCLFFIPGAALVAGIFIWFSRRK